MIRLGEQGSAEGRVVIRGADQNAEILRQPEMESFAPDGRLEEHSQGDESKNPNLKKRPKQLDPPRRAPSNTEPAPSKGILQEPIRPPNPSRDNVLVRLWKVVSQKLSDAVARLMEFLRRPRSKKPIYSKTYYPSDITGTGPFDIPIKQETNPLHPLVETGNRDLEVDNSFKEFNPRSTRHEPMAATGRDLLLLREFFGMSPVIRSKNHQYIEKELHSQLDKLDALLKYESQLQKSVAKGMEILAREIREILPRSSSMHDSAIPNLVQKISAYKSTVLLKDQTRIKSYLPEDQIYLVQLIGFFGPKNVLVPMVHDAIQRNRLTREAKWLSKCPEDFISKLEGIQKELEKLVAFNQEIELRAATGIPMSLKDQPDPSIMTTIKRIENQLIADLGGRDELKFALNDIESWDIHKELMKDMSDRSTHRLLLQLIEPWGYLRQYKKIPVDRRPYEEFGVVDTPERQNLKLLDTEVAPFALQVIQKQLKTAAGLKTVERNINDILTPDGSRVSRIF